MADIRKLTVPPGVTLLRGAMQNWSDLETLPPISPLLLARVRDIGPVQRCIVLGPHDTEFLAALADQVGELVVGVRAIPDAEAIATELPGIAVRCGALEDVVQDADADLVIALRDPALLATAEEGSTTWAAIVEVVLRARAKSGRVLMGLAADLSLERLGGPLWPGTEDDDGSWSPFSTWDDSRPRSLAQLTSWTDGLGVPSRVDVVHGSWASPAASGAGLADPRARRLLGLAALRGGAEVLPLRSAMLADAVVDLAPGWLVEAGPDAVGASQVTMVADGRRVTWAVDETGMLTRVVGDGSGLGPSEQVEWPPAGPTLLERYVIAAADSDLPRLRALMRIWNRAVETATEDGRLPASCSDVSFANAIMVGEDLHWLAPGAASRPVREAQLEALRDLLEVLLSQGLRHPWPSSMRRAEVFEAICAQAGVAAPADPEPFVARIGAPAPAASARTLRTVVERQREELRGLWSRFHWDERQHTVYQLKKESKELAKWGVRRARNEVGKVKRRVLG